LLGRVAGGLQPAAVGAGEGDFWFGGARGVDGDGGGHQVAAHAVAGAGGEVGRGRLRAAEAARLFLGDRPELESTFEVGRRLVTEGAGVGRLGFGRGADDDLG